MALIILGFLAEMAAATVTEHRLAVTLRAGAHLNHDPEVTVVGFPFLTARGHHTRLSIAVPATVHEREARLEADFDDVEIPGGLLPRFHLDTQIRATNLESRIRINQNTMGRYMDIVDLNVHPPAPNGPGAGSPADGWVKASEGIVLTGTVPVPTAKDPDREVTVSVAADFTNVGQSIAVRATGIYSGPEDHVKAKLQPGDEAVILAAFTRTLPPMALPFGLTATGARAENADVVLYGTTGAVSMPLGEFYRPLT